MTTENNEEISTNDAEQALKTVIEMERTSLQHSIPPKWFGIVLALVVGTLVFTIAASLRDYYVFPIIAIPIILAMRLKKTQALPKTKPMGRQRIVATICLVLLFLALIIGGRIFKEIYEMTWSPIVAGTLSAIIVYLLSVVERGDYLKKINGGE